MAGCEYAQPDVDTKEPSLIDEEGVAAQDETDIASGKPISFPE